MATPQPKAYYLSIQLYNQAIKKARSVDINVILAGRPSFNKTPKGEKLSNSENMAMLAQGFLPGLSTGARGMVLAIMEELKWNNTLWFFQPKNSRDVTNIKELKDNKIIFKTETTHIYFINPVFVRKGSLYEVLALTTELLSKSSKVTMDHIKDLRFTRKINFNAFDQMIAGDMDDESLSEHHRDSPISPSNSTSTTPNS